jgi:uncharacterized protein (TIGR03067 family)
MCNTLVRCAGFFCTLATLAFLPAGLARADDQEKFQGAWKVISARVADRQASPDQLKSMSVTVKADRFTLVEGKKKIGVHFGLNPKANPRQVDFFKTKKKNMRLWVGIYSLNGDRLELCWAPNDTDRPSGFATNQKNQNRYYILKKE